MVRLHSDHRRADHRIDGAVRLRENPRPWDSRGARSNPHRPQPDGSARRRSEAAVLGAVDRNGRPLRRRRPDHHDGRRARLAVCARLPHVRGRAQDAARRGRRGRHVGDLRDTGRRRAAGRRAATVRVEAAQLHSRCQRRRRRRSAACSAHGGRARIRDGAACGARLRWSRQRARRGADRGIRLRFADAARVCMRGRLHQAADSLDVVAGDRRPGRRLGWAPLSTRAGRRL